MQSNNVPFESKGNEVLVRHCATFLLGESGLSLTLMQFIDGIN